MNKCFYLAATLAVLPACSTKADLSPTEDGPASPHLLRFTAIPEADFSATRTTLDSDRSSLLWLPGDQINIFHKGCKPACFKNVNSEKAAIATFEGSITTHIITGGNEGSDLNAEYYWGLYPYDENAACEDGVILTNLPAKQNAVAGTFDDGLFITVGRSLTTEMPFYNVCSGIKFSLDREDIHTVTLTADGGQALAGTFKVAFDEEMEKPIIQEVCEGVSSITLTTKDGGYFQKGAWYYVVTLPQTLENENGFTFTFTLQGDEGTAPVRMRSTAPLVLNRSVFRKTAMKVNTKISTDIETPSIRSFLEDPEIEELYSTDMEYGVTRGADISCSAATVTFSWANTGERVLYISTIENFSEATKVSINASSTSTGVYNLVPDVTYYCRTVSADGKTYWETSFVPMGPFRALRVDGVGNARDLGGWKTQDGYQVKYGRVFRGKAPSASSTELLKLGATVEMDLRGYPNTQGTHYTQSPFGARFINRPVCQFMYGESSHLSGTSADDYQQAVREIITILQQGNGVFFHCIGGADRTGTLSYLILALLGVNEADLCKEYELTSQRTRNDNDTRPFKQLVFYLKTFKEYVDPDTGEIQEAKTLQDMVTFWALTKHPEENDGLGPFDPLTREDIETLKALLLDGYAL